MNYKFIIYLTIILAFAISCKNEKKVFERIEYDDKGRIERVKVYENKTEYDLDKNYISCSFYVNGMIQESTKYKNREKNGTGFGYKENGKLWYSYQYKNGLAHGVYRNYDEKGNVTTEYLLLYDKKILYKSKVNFYEDNSPGYGIFIYNRDSTVTQDWCYSTDEFNNPIPDKGWWYVVNSPKDTINFGEEYEFEIQMLLGGGNARYIQFFLGNINEDLEFIDSAAVEQILFKGEISTKYTTKKYEEGNNLLLGLIYIGKDTVLENKSCVGYFDRFIFYKDFYVKKKNE
jgi:hypothetical protein